MIALISGSITSGLGYVVWYQALRTLQTTTASLVQLLIPVLAAFGGVVFLDETLTLRLILSSVFILGGVVAGIRTPKSSVQQQQAAGHGDGHS